MLLPADIHRLDTLGMDSISLNRLHPRRMQGLRNTSLALRVGADGLPELV